MLTNPETLSFVINFKSQTTASWKPSHGIKPTDISLSARATAATLQSTAEKHLILLKKSGWGLEVGLFGSFLRGSYMLAYTQKTYAPLATATGPIPPATPSLN